MSGTTFGKRKSTLPASRNSGFSTPSSVQPVTFNTATSTLGAIPKAPAVEEYTPASHAQDGPVRAGEPVRFLRFASALIDSVIMMALFVGLMMLFADPAVESPDATEAELIMLLVLLIVPAMLYGIIMEASPLQGTIGKLATGTRITDMNGNRISLGRSIGRNLGKLLSGIVPFYIPYLMVFWTQHKQSLHDKMAGTLVFKKGEGPTNSLAEVFA